MILDEPLLIPACAGVLSATAQLEFQRQAPSHLASAHHDSTQQQMPRLPHSLLLRAHATNPLLPTLLRTCRDLPSARNELRWLREHAFGLAQKQAPGRAYKHLPVNCHARISKLRRTCIRARPEWRALLRRICEDRGRGKPLQYILGTQPFGEVEVLCRPGVLVPRSVWLSFISCTVSAETFEL